MSGIETETRKTTLDVNSVLLIAVIVLMVAGALLVMAMYGQSAERLEIPEVQPAVRVAQEESFPVGGSRLVRWGDRPVLVVRLAEREYVALQGASPNDGCVLEWEEAASRIVSPCTYVVYDVDGSVVTGLSTTPLQRYPVFVRDGTVYVARI
ncbi:MAG: Rieske (2Fe-2S) protein [Gemmatimonadales bacterium]|nr:Rieske (2Fe-2S) protein [Gemmatimonadales bacterium]